ncbi:hypothetical protein [Enhydrobacter aerosaccus]|uniref:hypothetical protein n=1 Tax=Enhydrobacter aerosaccus TaxID=225324 RepID=UPI001C4559BC|nr:hypothetical protein [Enhydrobacter aerosaccus]
MALCEGVIARCDLEAYLDGVLVEGALPYRKLFDLANAESGLVDGDMMALAARIQAYASVDPGGMGPLAIVASGQTQQEYAQLFAALTVSRRRLKIFRSAGAAEKWLAAPE